MKSALWIGGIVIFLGGCTAHMPPSTPLPGPIGKTESSSEPLFTPPMPVGPYSVSVPQELEIKLPELGPKINDLERFEQSIVPYVEENGADREELYEIQNTFEQSYYTPWRYTIPPLCAEDASWPVRAFQGGYGSNLRPVSPSWFKQIEEQSNFEAYGTINQPAIAMEWMDMRALPTDKPLYRNPELPGEGYPFDMLQNSSVNYHEPLFVSHTSKDGAWSYIFTNSASGWVKSNQIALIDDAKIEEMLKREKLFITEDNIPLYDTEHRFVTYSRVGMVLPLQESGETDYEALVYDTNGSFKTLFVPKAAAHLGVSKINKSDLIKIGGEMLKNTYGWGGMYGERDCSSMIRDMYTPFGIWLPRNSSSQGRKGEVVSFEGLRDDEKLSLIEEKGIPFETIIYLKGHVLLYIGTYQHNVMVMHNVWGVRTIDASGKKGRHIIGKAVVSTLELGSELNDFDPANKLLTRAKSMNIFTHQPFVLVKGKRLAKKK